jgi:DNA-binding transcriptional ArsR family regulator
MINKAMVHLMQEHYEIESIEQLRAIADILRLRIIDLLRQQPMTVTQLGDILGMAAAKVHYHVRELERVGLLRLVETREKGGILEKYYQPVAKSISVADSLLLSGSPDEPLAAIAVWFDQVKDGFQSAFRQAVEQKDERELTHLSLEFTNLHLTSEEHKQLVKQVRELLAPFEDRRGIEGERAVMYAQVSFVQLQNTPMLDSKVETSSPEGIGIVGVAVFDRAQLEKALAEGKRLRINVTGICKFADDIDPDLAERAVEDFHLIGKLQAPVAVYEILMRKRSR